MTQIKGTNVLAPVVPFDTTDSHASHEARYGKGGYRSVASVAERDGIPALRREAGMLVYVQATGNVWKLGDDLATWTEFSSGASTWSELSGKPTTFTPSAHTHTSADITDFTSAVVAAAPPTVDASLLSTGTLSASRLPASVVLTTDSRLSDARTPLAHTQAISTVTGLQAALDAKATPSDVSSAVAAVVNASPASLDTLRELAAALGDDANFASTVTNALAAKAPIASPTFTGTVSGITKSMVGLGNVDNTSDASKPVSTAQAAADSAVASSAASDATSKANAAQAYAIQRANHTGTQAASTITGLAVVATSGSYADLSNKPTIPEAVTSLPASSITGLATVATSGSYSDLTNKPSIPSAYSLPVATASVLGGVKQGSNVTIGADGTVSVAAPVSSLPAASITGLAAVATSGAYSSLTGLPTLGTAATASSSDFAAASHTHSLSSLTQSSATTGQVVTWSGSVWAPATPASSGSSLVSYATTASFPATGTSGTLYLASDTSKLYRWESTVYVEVAATATAISASDIAYGILSDARLSFVPLHPFLLMGG